MLHLSIDEVEQEGSTIKVSDEEMLKTMSDDDILFYHITGEDHELYRLECCLSELFGV